MAIACRYLIYAIISLSCIAKSVVAVFAGAEFGSYYLFMWDTLFVYPSSCDLNCSVCLDSEGVYTISLGVLTSLFSDASV